MIAHLNGRRGASHRSQNTTISSMLCAFSLSLCFFVPPPPPVPSCSFHRQICKKPQPVVLAEDGKIYCNAMQCNESKKILNAAMLLLDKLVTHANTQHIQSSNHANMQVGRVFIFKMSSSLLLLLIVLSVLFSVLAGSLSLSLCVVQ